MPEVICLSEDAIFRVRKAAALNMDAVCKTAGPALCSERLLPAFLKLSRDEVWGVRKACAESLVAVSKAVDAATRASVCEALLCLWFIDDDDDACFANWLIGAYIFGVFFPQLPIRTIFAVYPIRYPTHA